jgi:hypothetical protein
VCVCVCSESIRLLPGIAPANGTQSINVDPGVTVVLGDTSLTLRRCRDRNDCFCKTCSFRNIAVNTLPFVRAISKKLLLIMSAERIKNRKVLEVQTAKQIADLHALAKSFDLLTTPPRRRSSLAPSESSSSPVTSPTKSTQSKLRSPLEQVMRGCKLDR